jgi:DNA-binding transcriptional MerR regulator
MKMERKKFRIGELAQRLNIERFVIRFWEKEFGLTTTRSIGQQRFYDESDFIRLKRIKELLYQEGFTIAGAKKQLDEEKNHTRIIGSQKTTFETEEQIANPQKQIAALSQQILDLKKQLTRLQELL